MIPVRPLLVSGITFGLLFLAFPYLDIWASSLLYESGKGFTLLGNPVFDWIHTEMGYLAWAILLACLLVIILSDWSWSPRRLAGKRWSGIFVLLALIVGPGLMVNSLFKEHWGRARPMDVKAFDGPDRFTPAWVVSDQCDHNCSFVCGDASVGYGLMVIAFVSRRPRRWLAVGFGMGSALGLMRMAQGGHFLSDVIFSFYVVYLSAWFLHWIMSRLGLLPARAMDFRS